MRVLIFTNVANFGQFDKKQYLISKVADISTCKKLLKLFEKNQNYWQNVSDL